MQKKLDDLPHDSAFPLLVNRQIPQESVDLHTHDFTELVIIVRGHGVHYSETDAYEIFAGDCFVVAGAHGYRATHDMHLVNILFIPQRLSLSLHEAHKLPGYHAFFALEPKFRKHHNFRSRLRLAPEELAPVMQIIDTMEHELVTHADGFEFMATAFLMELIGRLSRAYTRMSGSRYHSLIRLGEVISHLERNYSGPVRIEHLTRMACMSESALLRAFREATGYAPIDYLIRLRIRQASVLLRRESFPVTEIAHRVGFNDSNYFTRQFSAIMGKSPRSYRRNQGVGG